MLPQLQVSAVAKAPTENSKNNNNHIISNAKEYWTEPVLLFYTKLGLISLRVCVMIIFVQERTVIENL